MTSATKIRPRKGAGNGPKKAPRTGSKTGPGSASGNASGKATSEPNGRKKIEELVTARIIELLDRGELPPWDRGWESSPHGEAMNALRKTPYRGVNRWMTMLTQLTGGYQDNRYLTFRQAQELGGSVRKGEKGTKVVYYAAFGQKKKAGQNDGTDAGAQEIIDIPADSTRKTSAENGAENGAENRTESGPVSGSRPRFFLKCYTVFNVEQTEGCKLPPLDEPELRVHDPLETAQAIVDGMRNPPAVNSYVHGNTPPHYMPTQDQVRVPDIGRYESPERWYATLFHELVHSTGHPKRLNRFLEETNGHGLHGYGREELVAGMGAAILSAKAGISAATVENDAAYIRSWRDAIAADTSMVLRAAALAQKASDYITGTEWTGPDGENGQDQPGNQEVEAEPENG